MPKDSDGVNVGKCDECGTYTELFTAYDPESNTEKVCERCLDKQIETVNSEKEQTNVPH